MSNLRGSVQKLSRWQILLGISLIAASGILYLVHYRVFRDLHHIFIFMVGDIAFVPIEVFLVSLLTATITAAIVERKIKEDLGLTTTKARGHTVICGWNPSGHKVLKGLDQQRAEKGKREVVLVADLSEEVIADLRNEVPHMEIHFVKGDHSHESVLKRANIQSADIAIILAEGATGKPYSVGDERTIITAYAINQLAPKVRICAELMDANNEQHLRRINVEDVVVTGEYGGYLLSSAVLSPGIIQVFKELLSRDKGNNLYNVPIPPSFIGKTVGELAQHFKAEQRALLAAILIREPGISLDALLRGEPSDIDEFIRRKFAEAEQDYLAAEKGRSRVLVNPPDDMVLEPEHEAIVIAARPREGG